MTHELERYEAKCEDIRGIYYRSCFTDNGCLYGVSRNGSDHKDDQFEAY